MRRCTIVGVFVVLTILVYKNLGVSANPLGDDHIPARARKAGASLRKKFLEMNADIPDSKQISKELPNPSAYSVQDQNNSTGSSEGEGDGESLVDGEKEEPDEVDERDPGDENEEKEEYEYVSEEEGSQEEECPEDEFWHVRGLKCVPLHCPGGNAKRDKDTGECLHLQYSNRRFRYGSRGTYIGRSGTTKGKSRLTFRIFRG